MQFDSDCSSAEEERRQRQQQHAGRAAAAATCAASSEPSPAPGKKLKVNSRGLSVASPPAPASAVELVQMHEMPINRIPQLSNMSKLLENCAHLKVNPFDGSPVCEEARQKILNGQSAKSGDKRKDPSPEAPALAAMMHDEAEETHHRSALSSPGTEDITKAFAAAVIAQQPDLNGHWVKDEFEKRIAALPRPVFYDPERLGAASITQEMLTAELMRGRSTLVVQSALLESHLLAEAGTFVSKTDPSRQMYFPPCKNGDQCRGMTNPVRGQTRKCVLTMLLFDKEYQFLIHYGQPPPEEVKRPCVLCCRYALTEAVVFARQIRMRGETQPGASTSVLPLARTSHVISQFYRNLCDEEGGYIRSHMLVTNHDPEDPILEPICMPASSMLIGTESEVLIRKEGKGEPRIVIDQSAIVWKAPVKQIPSIGERLLSFFGGAGKY